MNFFIILFREGEICGNIILVEDYRRTEVLIYGGDSPLSGPDRIRGSEVTVECFLSGGLPAFDVVGLPDAAVRESRERVRAAIKACGARFPVSRITVNLAPASQRKEGTLYDLPILLGILTAAEELRHLPEDAAFLGELSLTGALRPVTGVLPMALCARRLGLKSLYVPGGERRRGDARGRAHGLPG